MDIKERELAKEDHIKFQNRDKKRRQNIICYENLTFFTLHFYCIVI